MSANNINVNHTKNYRSIFKANAIFGGVQFFNIIITLIRGKAVALLIGPAGMGLNGLFLSGLNLVKTISSLGIAESAVRDLSQSYGNDKASFSTTYSVFKSWIWITGILGMAISILFAPLLSKFAFGNSSQTVSYMLISITFIFGALTGGIYTVLRATRKVSQLAKANIYGSVSALLVSLPILYVWGIDGVIYSIVMGSFTTFLVSLLFRKYVQVDKVELSLKEKIASGKPMVAMGINMSMSGIIGTGTAFALSIFISRIGGLEDFGFYSAGNSIMVGYVGMIFTSMSADYFPRLSQAMSDKEKWHQIINHQAEILILMLALVLSIMMGSISFLIEILLSNKFAGITGFILLSALSIPFKGLVWSLGYLYLSKGDSKVFLKNQLVGKSAFLLLNIAGYYQFGLIGIAIGDIIGFILSLVFNSIFVSRKYGFRFSSETLVMSFKVIALLSIIFGLSMYDGIYFMISKWLVITITVVYATYLLETRLKLLSSVLSRFKKKN